jgi:hypothetical protein
MQSIGQPRTANCKPNGNCPEGKDQLMKVAGCEFQFSELSCLWSSWFKSPVNLRVARNGLIHRSKHPSLFDHLVGAAGERQRDGDAERPGGLEIEELELRRLHHRQVRRLRAFEDAPGGDAGQTICVPSIASVAHQTTGGGKLSKLVDRWNAVAEGECAELRGVAVEQRIGGTDHERGCSQLRRRCEGRFEVGFGARWST